MPCSNRIIADRIIADRIIGGSSVVVSVLCKGTSVGEYFVDLLVADAI